jgi:hypothetical protein
MDATAPTTPTAHQDRTRLPPEGMKATSIIQLPPVTLTRSFLSPTISFASQRAIDAHVRRLVRTLAVRRRRMSATVRDSTVTTDSRRSSRCTTSSNAHRIKRGEGSGTVARASEGCSKRITSTRTTASTTDGA